VFTTYLVQWLRVDLNPLKKNSQDLKCETWGLIFQPCFWSGTTNESLPQNSIVRDVGSMILPHLFVKTLFSDSCSNHVKLTSSGWAQHVAADLKHESEKRVSTKRRGEIIDPTWHAIDFCESVSFPLSQRPREHARIHWPVNFNVFRAPEPLV